MSGESGFEEGTILNGKIRLHYIASGPATGEPVLLLHGFPQFSYMWRHQLKALAEAGYRAIAPDLRGYNLSSRPMGTEAYTFEELSGDLQAFYKTLGWKQANLVGHDWGGAIAWYFAINHPEQVKRLVAISMPHLTAFRAALTNPEQLFRSSYAGFFQIPVLPEWLGETFVNQFVNGIFGTAAQKSAFSQKDLDVYREMLSQPGQIRAGLNYYRANANPFNSLMSPFTGFPPGEGPSKEAMMVRLPVALLYGNRDPAFSHTAWEKTRDYCKGYYKAFELENVAHWVPEEAPKTVNKLLLQHLSVEIPE